MYTPRAMTLARRSLIAVALIAGVLASCDRVPVSGDDACESPTNRLPEGAALDALEQVVATRGLSLASGASTYVHVGDDVIAHAPLAGIESYSDADFAGGVPVAAVVVARAAPGALPDGAYVAMVQFAPASTTGVVTFLDAAGRPAGRRFKHGFMALGQGQAQRR